MKHTSGVTRTEAQEEIVKPQVCQVRLEFSCVKEGLVPVLFTTVQWLRTVHQRQTAWGSNPDIRYETCYLYKLLDACYSATIKSQRCISFKATPKSG